MCLLLDMSVYRKIITFRLDLMMRLVLALLTIIFTGPVFTESETQAGETRHHEAHEHGVASLNVAVEGNNIYMEFTSPAANIVGFEHHPRTHDQKVAVEGAVKKLQAGDALFILSDGSKSRLVKSRVDTDIDKDADHHSESEHAHEEAQHHDKEHSEADEHERHSEFKAEYHFVCKNPNKLSQIDVKLFQVFPGIEHIKVQLISRTMQSAVELTAKKNKISL